jgi:hypothetical protein
LPACDVWKYTALCLLHVYCGNSGIVGFFSWTCAHRCYTRNLENIFYTFVAPENIGTKNIKLYRWKIFLPFNERSYSEWREERKVFITLSTLSSSVLVEKGKIISRFFTYCFDLENSKGQF